MRDYDVRPPFQEPVPREKKRTRRKRKIGSTVSNVLTKLIALSILVLLILVMVLPSWKPYRDKMLEYLVLGLEYYQEDPEYAEFKVERIMTLTLSGQGTVGYTLSLGAPEDEKINKYWIQDVKKFEVTTSDSNAVFTEEEGLRFWNGSISGGSTVTVSVMYHIRAYNVKWDINADNSAKIDAIPQDYVNNYTIDRWIVFKEDGETERDVDNDTKTPDYVIEPNNPLLNDLAHYIIGNEDNVRMMAGKIYDFMKKGVTFNGTKYGPYAYPDEGQMNDDRSRYYGKPKPAYVTLHDGYGDCDDQAILFITLCRAVGIPGWLESGALYNQWSPDPDNAWEGHGWAKILIPMKNGKMEEPSVDPVNNLFLERDPNRFHDWEDPGGEQNENKGDIPDTPLDIEKYYTSWTYQSNDPGIDLNEDLVTDDHYETHFYNQYKSNLEIRV